MVIRFLIFCVAVFAVVVARQVILLGFLSIILAILLSFPIEFFSKYIPRGISVTLTLILLAGGTTGLVFFTLPTISKQVNQLKEEVPKVAKEMQNWVMGAERKVNEVPSPKHSEQNESQSTDASKSEGEVVASTTAIANKAVSLAFHVLEGISTFIFVLILSIFLAAQPDEYRMGIRLLVPPQFERNYDELWHRQGIALRHWVGGAFIDMTVMGTLTGIGLWIVGIDDAIVLGLITFFATFVPYLGALLSSIPGLFMGLSKSPSHMLYAAGVYLFVHILEGYIVSPLIMKQVVQLKPALLLFGQVVMGVLFGVIGVVVATPFLVSLQTFLIYTYVERKLDRNVKNT